MAPLGNLVRLLPLHINELPAHPALESLVSTPPNQNKFAGSSPSQAANVEPSERPNLISFMEEVLDQATIFIDDTLPATFKEGALKKSAPALAKVRILSRKISVAEIEAIPWINTSMCHSSEDLLPPESRDIVREATFSFVLLLFDFLASFSKEPHLF